MTDTGISFSSQPEFTVVIPTRDRPDLLQRALHHIQQQTHAGFEVIVVDDGSVASTLARYDDVWKQLDGRFSLALRDPTQRRGSGPSAARNHGIALGRGTFITFCDDDDYWTDPRHLEIAAEALRVTPEVDLFIANQQGVNAAGQITIADWMPHVLPRLAERRAVGRGGVFLIERGDLVRPAGQVGHLNATILRRRVIEDIKGFWEAISYEEDREFLLRALDERPQLLFRRDAVAIHSVPESSTRINASTQLSALDKWLIRILTSQHVMTHARSAEVLFYARTLAGHAYRHVALHFVKNWRYNDAQRFARGALAMNPNWRWSLYTLYVMFRSLCAGFHGRRRSISR